MNIQLNTLRPEEKATLTLRGLYEKYGYKKYKISQFEEYNLYLKYKSFLTSDKILTFTDLDGKLLALKPDVTLSIVKNTKANTKVSEKAYYLETVYRESKESNTFKEISQMGLEYLGCVNSYAVAETVYLAKRSLAEISPDFILELGHMDFVTGLLDSFLTDTAARSEILRCLSAKSVHELQQVCELAGIENKDIQALVALCYMNGDYTKTIQQAKSICRNAKMQAALDELQIVYDAAKDGENDTKLKLDFTLLNDTEYYNGIIMAGYLEGLPRMVLSGGRYDSMMHKLGKSAGAVGFAIYLDELERLPVVKQPYDTDILVLADKNADTVQLLQQIKLLTQKEMRVMVCSDVPPDFKFKTAYKFTQGGLVEC